MIATSWSLEIGVPSAIPNMGFCPRNLFNLEIAQQHTTSLAEDNDISNSFMQIYKHTRHLYNNLLKLNYLIDGSGYDFTANLKSELDAVRSDTNHVNLLKGIQKYKFYEIPENSSTQDW